MRRVVRFTIRPVGELFRASHVSDGGVVSYADGATPEIAIATLTQGLERPDSAVRGSWLPVAPDVSIMPNRWVMFVDVLGFRALQLALVDEDRQRRDAAVLIADRLLSILDMDVEQAKWKNLVGIIHPWPDLRISGFSDSIILSIEDRKGGLSTILHFAGALMEFALLECGALLRGGISFGPTLHSDATALGPAIVEAVNLEKSTKMPRFGVSNAALAKAKTDASRHFVEVDEYGSWFDLIGHVRQRHECYATTFGPDMEQQRLDQSGEYLRLIGADLESLAPNAATPPDVATKKLWSIRRFNTEVTSLGMFHGLAPAVAELKDR